MQQRRLRLGDILDDYCPRERRITNHAVVAMIEDQVKQTRCTTCDADHEYKQARVPVRRKKDGGALVSETGTVGPRPRATVAVPVENDEALQDEMVTADESVEIPHPTPPTDAAEPAALMASANHDANHDGNAHGEEESPEDAQPNEDGPVHRRLIRATLPRPEGQAPDWKNPDFTVRQPTGGRGGGGFDSNRNGHRPPGRGGGGRRPAARAQGNAPGQPTRFGGPRQGNSRPGSGQPHGHGSNRPGSGRPGPGQGQGPGQNRGQRPGGHGRKRGR